MTVLHPPGLQLRHLPCSSLVLLTMDRYQALGWGRAGEPQQEAGMGGRLASRAALAVMGQLLALLCLASPSLETNK